MKSQTGLKSIVANYPIILRELVAALVAGLLVAFAIATLWLVAAPSASLVLVLALILLAVLLLSYLCLHLILYPPRSRAQKGLRAYGLTYWEDIGFEAGDGVELGAWYVPPAPETQGAAVIFLHGLGGNRGDLASQVAMVVRHGYGALAIDMRNHGRSAAAMTTLGYREVEDVYGAVAYLLSRPGINSGRIALFGNSMGAATAICATARIPQVRAVIAQSAFTSLEENIETGVVAQLGLPPFPFVPLITWLGERSTGLRISRVRPIDDVARISPRPILFIHGRQDGYVSADNSRRLYAQAYEPKALYLIDHADHKSPMLAEPETYEKRVMQFLGRSLLGQPA